MLTLLPLLFSLTMTAPTFVKRSECKDDWLNSKDTSVDHCYGGLKCSNAKMYHYCQCPQGKCVCVLVSNFTKRYIAQLEYNICMRDLPSRNKFFRKQFNQILIKEIDKWNPRWLNERTYSPVE